MSTHNQENTMTTDRPRPITLVDRTYTPSDWRHTTYQRPDGSTVHVTIPPYKLVDSDGHPAGLVYDEAAEAEMLQRLVAGGDQP